ncbi:MAG: hypothetical protein ACR2KJ_04650 [Jatrophihabitans sp.]
MSTDHPTAAGLRDIAGALALADEQLLARAAGEYWRTGGWVGVVTSDSTAMPQP